MIENSLEKAGEKVVIGVEFSSDNGLIIWREVYGDNSVGVWETTNLETNDKNGLKSLREDLQEEYGEDVKI